jgi:hypothetical protein
MSEVTPELTSDGRSAFESPASRSDLRPVRAVVPAKTPPPAARPLAERVAGLASLTEETPQDGAWRALKAAQLGSEGNQAIDGVTGSLAALAESQSGRRGPDAIESRLKQAIEAESRRNEISDAAEAKLNANRQKTMTLEETIAKLSEMPDGELETIEAALPDARLSLENKAIVEKALDHVVSARVVASSTPVPAEAVDYAAADDSAFDFELTEDGE